MSDELKGIKGFDWNEGNVGKSERKHGITDREAEEVFFNQPIWIAPSKKFVAEKRLVALGKTNAGALLTIVFTVRQSDVRVISARPMSRKERQAYEKTS